MIREIISVAGKFYESMYPYEEGSSTTRVTNPTWPAKSIYALMKEIGCIDSKIKINEKEIYDELINCPECIEQWVAASADQRGDSDTWAFLATSNGRYVVSRLANPDKNRLFQQTIFTDGYKACANFLMHLIEHYKEVHAESNRKLSPPSKRHEFVARLVRWLTRVSQSSPF